MKPYKVVLYARVSHDEQKKYGFSIENQLEKLRKYAEDNNMIVVAEYVDEGYSAGNTKRPELQRLLSQLNKFELIIFTRLDRFSRNVLDANEMVQLFNRSNVSIKAIEEDIDTSTADGMFDFNLKVSLAQRELEKGAERIKTVFDYKVKHGQAITGNQSWGYKVAEVDGIKRVIKDEEAAPMVEDMFNHFLQFQSIRGTLLYLNNKYGLERRYISINRNLKNEIYMGKFRDNENYCEPYISRETFYRVQDIIKNNIRVRKNNYVYLFSGLIPCPHCGAKMSGLHQRGRNREYYYYRCGKRILSKVCNGTKNISEERIEEFLLQNINRLIEDYIFEVEVTPDNTPQPQIDIKEITEEMDRLNYQFKKKRISHQEYDFEYEQLEKQLAEAEKQLPDETDISGLEAFLNSGWQNVYNTLDKTEKRALFRSVIKQINIDTDGKITIDFL